MKSTKIDNQISVERHNYGPIKVALLHKYTIDFFLGEEKNAAAVARNAKIDLHMFDITHPWFLRADAPYKDYETYTKQEDVKGIYDTIYSYVKKNNIKIVLVFWTGPLWNEDFIEKLKGIAYVACYFGDDPDEGSEVTSKHYVRFYDYAFCGGVYFDEHKTVARQFIDWGAKRSMFIPLGAKPTSHPGKYPDFNNRNIGVVYIGTNKFKKFFFVARVKRHFGNRMQIYGRGWNKSESLLKTIVLKLLKIWYGVGDVRPLSQKDILDAYARSKIGLNMHQSFGPSNVRTYELPLNGVMQVSDNEKGYADVFRIGKEIITYRNHDHKDAIHKIEYYLVHDKERQDIAEAGYKRAVRDYRLEKTFTRLIDEIKKQPKYKRLARKA